MIEGAWELRSATKADGHRPIIQVINRSAAGIEQDERLLAWKAPLTAARIAGASAKRRDLLVKSLCELLHTRMALREITRGMVCSHERAIHQGMADLSLDV